MILLRHSTKERLNIGDDSCLGVGGEAKVFLVPNHPALVAKVYHHSTEAHRRKLEAMLANPPTDPTQGSGHLSIAWPTDLLLENEESPSCAGFLMARVTEMVPIIDFFHPRTRRLKSPLFNYFYLHRTARNLAACFLAVHEKGYVIGDVNESNILVRETAMVTLVDTDSFQIPGPDGTVLHRCPVGKPDYTPREMHGRPFDQEDRQTEQDRFGLAVLIFQLLMEGTHPFAGVYQGRGEAPQLVDRIALGDFPFADKWFARYTPPPAAPPFELLHPSLRDLFLRCFCDGHKDPAKRPSAAEWRQALGRAENDLAKCSVNAQHRFGSHLNQCPWCERIRRLGGLDAFPSVDAVEQGAHLNPGSTAQTSPALAARKAPTVRPSTFQYSVGQLKSVSAKAWASATAPPALQGELSGVWWKTLVLLGLLASWGVKWFSGSYAMGAGLGAATGLLGSLAAWKTLRGRDQSILAQPVLWMCVVSVALQLCLHPRSPVGPQLLAHITKLVLPRAELVAKPAPAAKSRIIPEMVLAPPVAPPPVSSDPTAPSTVVAAPEPPQPASPAPAPPAQTLASLRLTNSLGMQFVPMPFSNRVVCVSIWETRVRDYDLFISEAGQPDPTLDHSKSNHPIFNVSWSDATNFCGWLTERERKNGWLAEGDCYRLPARQEWEAVAGVSGGPYPWGPQATPPLEAENVCKTKGSTLPVGSAVANELGCFDLGGNVREWVADFVPDKPKLHAYCGGSHRTPLKSVPLLFLDKDRSPWTADKLAEDLGFRVVLDKATAQGLMNDFREGRVMPSPPELNRRWTNGLGMRFVPLPGSRLLLAIWETRVCDYAPFARATGREAVTDDCPTRPVRGTSWVEANRFCQWLTRQEQGDGRLAPGQRYRLPTDLEWSYALGLSGEEGRSPSERHEHRDQHGYPWRGQKWTGLPKNFGKYDDVGWPAAVGSYPANDFGVYDLAGNVWEWCQDDFAATNTLVNAATSNELGVLRGGAMTASLAQLQDSVLSAFRKREVKTTCRRDNGFRVVVELEPAL